MTFNSIGFLFFFAIVVIIHALLPFRAKYIFLLIASYFFYMCWNFSYGFLLLGITVITYLCGKMISQLESKKKKDIFFAIGIILVLSILFTFKYLDFALINVNHILDFVQVKPIANSLDLVLPLGISFYTFQAMGYLCDVYFGKIKFESSFLQYALFVSFFPQLIAGPIERAKNILCQIKEKKQFNVDKVRSGLLFMAWGYFNKILIADNLALIINPIIESYESRLGVEVALAVMLYGLQIYCDFAGYSYIAIGLARVLGYNLQTNFNCPYLATSVDGFWQRWHMSLTSWFRDYLYIPLGGNRKGALRQYINILIVFLVSGLWHGASWSFVIWGGLNGLMIVISKMKKKVITVRLPRLLAQIITFCLIDFTWLFFRASDFSEAMNLIKRILFHFRITEFSIIPVVANVSDELTRYVILLAIIILLVVDILKYNQVNVIQWILGRKILFRWVIYLALIFGIILFGQYGNVDEQTQFIYFQF